MSTEMFCPTCQEENMMRVGGVRPSNFDVSMVGQIGYECKVCKTFGCGPSSSYGLICSFAPLPFVLEVDGNMWCAKRHDFINLQESIAGFGDTRLKAIEDCIRQEQQAKEQPNDRT